MMFHRSKKTKVLLPRLLLTFIVVLLACPAVVSSEPSLDGLVSSMLPSKLRKFKPGTTKRKSIVERLGNPAEKSDARTYHYQLADKKYDTTLVFDKKDRLAIVNYEPTSSFWKKKPTVETFRPWISPKMIDEAFVKLAKGVQTHETGRTFDIEFKKKGIRLTFNNNSKKTLQSIMVWKPAGKSGAK